MHSNVAPDHWRDIDREVTPIPAHGRNHQRIGVDHERPVWPCWTTDLKDICQYLDGQRCDQAGTSDTVGL